MGQVVLLIGEPGLGKSRLVHTMKEHVKGESSESARVLFDHPLSTLTQSAKDSPVVEWRCSPQFQNSSLYPVAGFFERLLRFGRDEGLASRFDRLVQHLSDYGLGRPDVVPLFASLLSLAPDDRFPLLGLSPVREREETFRALLEWLRAYSAQRPVLFVVEDLHWVDASTLELLGQFLAEGLHDRVLTLLTFRTEFKTPWPALAHQTSLALNRLTRRQVSDLMKKKIGEDLPEEVVHRVYDRTGGVPLFVEEFTKMVQESRVLDGAGSGKATANALLLREIPVTLQDLIMARLDRMEGDREVIQMAGTLGREFSYELIAAATALDEPTLQAELAKLVQAEILCQKGHLPNSHYSFKHALLEDAAYNSLIKPKRQQFHQRIAEMLEAKFPQIVETQPELLAHHFTEAGQAEKGVSYWLTAGLRSQERSANIEAIGHLTKGLASLDTLPASTQRDARELEFLNPLGTAYIASYGYGATQVSPIFLRARELCERVGQPQQLFGIMWGNWAYHIVRGDFRRYTVLATEAMELAERLADPGILMEASFFTACLFFRGKLADARDGSERALTNYENRERCSFWLRYLGQDSGVAIRSCYSSTLWLLGYPDQALRVSSEACELARQVRHPFSLGFALWHRNFVFQHCRLQAEARATADEQIALGTEQGFAWWLATGVIFRGAALLLQGHVQEAMPVLLKGLDANRATGAQMALPYYHSMLGDAYAKAGRYEDARLELDEGLRMVETNDERFQEAELHRLKGETLLAESPNHAAAAEELFHHAIQIARRQNSKSWDLRSTLSLARLWQQQGRRDEARDALSAVYGTFTEGFTMPDLVDAAALLRS
jgi:predicted ATPase/energy-coupling factor transporter ATP-binding protein EcfA2